MSARALNGHALTFVPPPMTPDDHELFIRHLSISARHFESDCRTLTSQIRPVLAVVTGLAKTVGSTPPGEPARPMFITLSEQDVLLVRAFLDRSLQRAADEAADGGRPGHNDAARRGVQSLLDQFESLIRFRDPRTGRRARHPAYVGGDE